MWGVAGCTSLMLSPGDGVDHEPVKAVFARYAAASIDVAGEGGQFLRDCARRQGVTLMIGVSERVGAGRQ